MARVQIELPEEFIFEYDIPVRVSDLNYGGHVGHDSVLTLLQEARVAFYRQLGFQDERSFAGPVGQVISDASVQYRSESFLGDILTIKIAVLDISRFGFDMMYLMKEKNTGREVARAKTGIVCFDYSKSKIAAVPEELKSKLAVKLKERNNHETP